MYRIALYGGKESRHTSAQSRVRLGPVSGRAIGIDAVRLLGIILTVLASAGFVYAVRATMERERPADVLFALLAWCSLVIALLGIALVFVPGFLG